MDNLYDKFIKEYMKELSDLSIGYSFNRKRLDRLNDIYNAIYYINSDKNIKAETALKITQYYVNI